MNFGSDSIYMEGEPTPKPTDAPIAYSISVSTDYFRTMRTRLLMGREFDSRDKQDGTRVAVVNKSFVDQVMHGQDPIGKHIVTDVNDPNHSYQVIGVVVNNQDC